MDIGNKNIEVFVRHAFHSLNQELPNRKRPEWYSRRSCFYNLRGTIDADIANLTIVYDKHFGIETPDPPFNLIIGDWGTEAKSFLGMLDYVLSKDLPPTTIIYFVEDDYLHREGWCTALLEAFSLPINYVSLYDHFDKYIDYPDLQSKIFVTPTCHWRTTPSTCNTYACRMSQLTADIDIHRAYSANCVNGISNDCGKFEHLTRIGRTLITPMPGYSTHVNDYMSPVIDWKKINDNAK